VVECSNGIFVGNRPQGSRRDLGPASTWFALESADADVAVFEDYFGRINRFGFAYEWSDVAVCTNVTPDHLHHFGVHTLEQLAEVKFAVISRARHGVVLNADNAGCAGMLSRATARRKVAVSMSCNRAALVQAHPGVHEFCLLEQQDGQDFIVLYDGEARIPLLAANDIPATRLGQARHNTSNAMHAASAAWLLGVSPAHIAMALHSFAVDFETCPGRLNEFTGLPFRVIMDYAHNEDGLRQIRAFVDAQQVAGRKLIKCSFYDDRRASEIRAAVRLLAGHFDRFTCSRISEKRRVVTENIPELMQRVLLEEGVAQEAITLAPDSATALQLTLDQAQAGDLVVLLADSAEFKGLWQHLGRMRAALESPRGVE
jgi:cyanophycin synthetase